MFVIITYLVNTLVQNAFQRTIQVNDLISTNSFLNFTLGKLPLKYKGTYVNCIVMPCFKLFLNHYKMQHEKYQIICVWLCLKKTELKYKPGLIIFL